MNKSAKIFGHSAPDLLESQLPYEQKKKEHEKYLRRKAKEAPTGHIAAMGGGGVAGGLLGSVAGAALGSRYKDNPLLGTGVGAASGGALGGGLGAAIGAAARYHDKAKIQAAKRILQSGDLDSALNKEIGRQRNAERAQQATKEFSKHVARNQLEKRREGAANRRHDDLKDSLKDFSKSRQTKDPSGPSKVTCSYCGTSQSPKPNCTNCGAPLPHSKVASVYSAYDLAFEKMGGMQFHDPKSARSPAELTRRNSRFSERKKGTGARLAGADGKGGLGGLVQNPGSYF